MYFFIDLISYRDVFAERHRLQSQVFRHGLLLKGFAEHTGKISQMKKVGTTLPFLILYWNNQWLFRTIEDTDRVKVVQNIRKLCPTPPVWGYPVWPLRHRLPCQCPSNIIGGKVVRGSVGQCFVLKWELLNIRPYGCLAQFRAPSKWFVLPNAFVPIYTRRSSGMLGHISWSIPKRVALGEEQLFCLISITVYHFRTWSFQTA